MTQPITFRAGPAPCPVCDSPTKGCSATDDGMHICRGDPMSAEWRRLTTSPDAAGFHHYRRGDDSGRPAPIPAEKKAARRKAMDWPAVAAGYAASLRPADKDDLARRLGLPVACLAAIPLLGASGANSFGSIITFPEHDGTGKVVGISERTPVDRSSGADEKKQLAGGKRGLTLPAGWDDPARTDPLFIVEGPTDTLAMVVAGLSAIGRPGNASGERQLAELLASFPAGREIVIVGENDLKTDGKWPGRDGAVTVSISLASTLQRAVRVAMPPAGSKDVRAWLTDQARGDDAWEDRGKKLLGHLMSAASHPPIPKGLCRKQILIGTDEKRVNDDAISALLNHEETFQRGGQLVFVSWEGESTDTVAKDVIVQFPSGPRIVGMSHATLRERLTEVADWKIERTSESGNFRVPEHPPQWSVQAIIDRGSWKGMRKLHALADFPCFVAGGKLLTKNGFDIDTGVYYSPSAPVELTIPPNPTLADAKAALETLAEVVVDFPFLHPHHRSAWLAGLLTPLARFAFRGPSPLFLVEANVPGAGKGMLVETANLIVRGEEAAGLDFPHRSEELEKVVTSILSRGEMVASFDNIEGNLGGAALNRLLTLSIWEGRILGVSITVRVPTICTWWGTGNNVMVVGDTLRRVLSIRLESKMESPEVRDNFKHENLKEWVLQNRPRLLSAALTILKAYFDAGKPNQKLPKWGSYESWSALIRGAIVWAGWKDPFVSQPASRSQGDYIITAMGVLLANWDSIKPGSSGLTARQIIEVVEQEKPPENLADIIEAVAILAPSSSKDRSSALGYKFRKFSRRNINGKCIVKVGSHSAIGRWAAQDAEQPDLFPETDEGGDGMDGGDILDQTRVHARTHTPARTHAGDLPKQSPPSIPSPPVDESGIDLSPDL